MLVPVDPSAASSATTRRDGQDLEIRWLVRVAGSPAWHHTLRVSAPDVTDAGLLGTPLPRWRAASAAWASHLGWRLEVRPRVLRSTDTIAESLGVTDTAAALVILEQGRGQTGIRVDHELVVLAVFADQALPTGWQQEISRLPDRCLTTGAEQIASLRDASERALMAVG
jgi:hypothetical protein